MKQRNILAAVFVVVATSASAQDLRPSLSADHAQAVIAGCVAYGKEHNLSQALAVSDAGGNLVAFLRPDGNKPGIGEFAIKKAKAVSMWGFSTSGMAEGAKDYPGFANAPHVVTVPGGVPIYSADGRHFLGAAGASGEAPENDEACIIAGIAAAGLTHERNRD